MPKVRIFLHFPASFNITSAYFAESVMTTPEALEVYRYMHTAEENDISHMTVEVSSQAMAASAFSTLKRPSIASCIFVQKRSQDTSKEIFPFSTFTLPLELQEQKGKRQLHIM